MIVTVLSTCLHLAMLGSVLGHYNGAPTAACGDMTPGHGAPLQTTPPPYTITPSIATVGGNIEVILSGSQNFTGFFLQARDDNNGILTGTFDTRSQKVISCPPGVDNAVTHAGNSGKSSEKITWSPPRGFTGNVTFKATFVKNYAVIWVGVESDTINIGSDSEYINEDTKDNCGAPAEINAGDETLKLLRELKEAQDKTNKCLKCLERKINRLESGNVVGNVGSVSRPVTARPIHCVC